MNTPEDDPEETLKGINPADLLARGLESAKAATGNPQAWQPPTPAELAALLPQYEIESLLGRGGMGAVYRGKQAALDRAVAIKLLPAELAADAEFVNRFQREARTLARLQHPGIVAVHDFGQTSEGHLYFVMEFVNGTDLARLIHGPGINPVQALEVITQICDALQYAHGQGVIHRDIKPANVLINLDGRAKLADFGLARPTSEETASLTRSNVVMGTPDYMAPEQMAGNADHRADLYALGVMLYEMLTGQTPRGAWAPPSQRVQVDVRLDQVVVRALQQDPAMRYQQASEIKTDVDVIRTTPLPKLNKGKAKNTPEAPGQRTTPLPKAKKPVNKVALAAIIVLPLLALAGWWMTQKPASPTATASNVAWQRVEHTDEEWRKMGRTVVNGWIPADSPKGRETLSVFDLRPHRHTFTRYAVRTRVELNDEPDHWVEFRYVNDSHAILFRAGSVEVKHPEGNQKLFTGSRVASSRLVEVVVIDGTIYSRIDDGTPMRFSFQNISPCKGIYINGSGPGDRVKDIEYVNLDGIPDPLRALGWEAADSTAMPVASSQPVKATKDVPFVNSLGMKFVPVPGTDSLMCIHETRRKDYAAYAVAVPGVDATWKNPSKGGKLLMQNDDHPVVQVSWEDASAFCAWLSKKEGRTYRLPTEREWNLAVVAFDLNDPRSISDAALMEMLKPQYPSGTSDNQEMLRHGNYIEKADGYEGTAPVMSFLPNRLGIFDLGGNAWEWCDGWVDIKEGTRVLRGCGFLNYGPYRVSATREGRDPFYRTPTKDLFPGFRVVIEHAPAKPMTKVDEPKPAATASSGNPIVDEVVGWVFKKQGNVLILQRDKFVSAKSLEQIPPGRFDLIKVHLPGEQVTDAEFARLGSVPTLWCIELKEVSHITSLKPIAGLTKLQHLWLSENKGLEEEELAHLAGMNDLSSLRLRLPGATGESFRHLQRLPKLTLLSLHDAEFTEEGAKAIAGLGSLEWLLLLNDTVREGNQKSLSAIGQMPKLTSLDIDGTLTSEGFAALSPLKLKKLNLSSCKLDNAGFPLLTGSRDTLTELPIVWGATVSDEGIRHIVANFPNIESIGASTGSTCTGASLRELAKLPKLKKISWWVKGMKTADYVLLAELPLIEGISVGFGSAITDEALPAFAKCQHLKELNLDETAITDKGLKALQNIRPLATLNLTKTKITAAGLAEFQKARPDVKVTHSLNSTSASTNPPAPKAETTTNGAAEAKKRLVESRAHLKMGDLAETRKLAEAALTTAPGDLTTQAEAALILAEAQAPERALSLANDFVRNASAEHPQFAATTEARVKLMPKMREYRARLAAAAKLVTTNDDAGELSELQAALKILPDGREAADRLEMNPLHVGRALPGRKFANELGHTFVPVDGLPNVLFSTWETRVKDFEQFVKETGHDMSGLEPYNADKTRTWQKPGFEQSGDHPVVLISRQDARDFCDWMTKKERASGRLLPGQVYRLPTDREWSAAMGELNEPGDFPEDRQFPENVFTWPKGSPPPRNAENLNSSWNNDDFLNTAPVGSGTANQFGIYDLIGNVKEICADPWGIQGNHDAAAVLRGSSYNSELKVWRYRQDDVHAGRVRVGSVDVGFRCVLDLKTVEQRKIQTLMEEALVNLQTSPVTQNRPRREINTLVNDEMVLMDLRRWWPLNEAESTRLTGLPLTHLMAMTSERTGSLAVMKTFPLKVLFLSFEQMGEKPERFLESLKGLPLTNLHLAQHIDMGLPLHSIEILAGAPLRELHLWNFKNLKSIEALRGMPLETVVFGGTNGTFDLSPLKEARLRQLGLPETLTLERFVQACEWWEGTVETLNTNMPEVYGSILMNAALSGDAAKVDAAKSTVEGKMKSLPWLKTSWNKAEPRDIYQRAYEFWSRAARHIGGDAAAFEGQFKTFGGHSYLWCGQRMALDEATTFARQLGANVLSITSQAESDFIIEQIKARVFQVNFMLGLERSGKGKMGWKWVSGESLEFHNWGPESGADGTSASLVESDGRMVWYHNGKATPRPFIIEWDTPTPQRPVKQ